MPASTWRSCRGSASLPLSALGDFGRKVSEVSGQLVVALSSYVTSSRFESG